MIKYTARSELEHQSGPYGIYTLRSCSYLPAYLEFSKLLSTFPFANGHTSSAKLGLGMWSVLGMSIVLSRVALNLSSIFLIQWTYDEKELHPTLIRGMRLLVLHVNQKSQLGLERSCAWPATEPFCIFRCSSSFSHRTGMISDGDPQSRCHITSVKP